MDPLPPILFRSFRSLVVLADCSTGTPEIPADALCDWLPRWDAWFKQRSGIEDGLQMDLLYGRALQFLGRNFLAHPEPLVQVSSVATPLGFGCALTLSVLDCQRSWNDVEALLARSAINSIYLDGREAMERTGGVLSNREIVERLVDGGMSLILIGPVEVWKADGLFASPVLNRTNWQLIPASSGADGRTARVTSIESTFHPCRERFSLFITADGAIYPCQGLVGLSEWSLGNLQDRVTDAMLVPSHAPDSLRLWAARGPGITGSLDGIAAEDLPPICRLHRAQLAGGDWNPSASPLPAASTVNRPRFLPMMK